MNYQEMLIKFMEAKQQKLKEIGCEIPYFTSKDAEAIRQWDDKIAKNVWETIKENIEDNVECGLDAGVCPFCMKQEYFGGDCESCEYAKNHGICTRGDYQDIWRFLYKRKIDDEEILSYDFYQELIEKIEKEAKE